MSTMNFHLGNNMGIVLAETAQQKFFDTFSKEEAMRVFKESLGCDDNFAEKLLVGKYAVVPSSTNKIEVNCVEREDLTEEQKKDYPVLSASAFIIKIINDLGGDFAEFDANGFIGHMREVRDAMWKDTKFTITSDLSEFLLKDIDTDIFAEVHITARNITKVLIEKSDNAQDLKNIMNESYLVRAKGYLNPNKFVARVLNMIYLKECGQDIVNCMDYFESNKDFFNITDEHEYKFFKIKACIKFCTELYDFCVNNFEWNEELFKR